MRPLFHPAVKDITVQGILHALSDPTRAKIYGQLMNSDCSQNCVAFSEIGESPLAKATLSQHFRILREAGLIFSERKGVELHNTTRCADLKEKYGLLISTVVEAYSKESEDCAKRSAKARKTGSTPRK